MKFGIFYEHQLPRPWAEGAEEKLLHEALDQVELADKLGIDFAWEVQHHFLEEYSHSSAPEVFLAACSQRTKNIRLGHICESLQCFAKEVMPEFRKDEAAREAKKRAELAPFIEAAFKRKQAMPALAPDKIPSFPAYGLTAPPVDLSTLPEANRRRALAMRQMRKIAEKSGKG